MHMQYVHSCLSVCLFCSHMVAEPLQQADEAGHGLSAAVHRPAHAAPTTPETVAESESDYE